MSMSYPTGNRYATPEKFPRDNQERAQASCAPAPRMALRVPDAAVAAGVAEVERITAAPDLEAERIGGETPEGFVVRAALAAALPHLVDDKAVKRAARALWAEGHRTRSPPYPDAAYWEQIARRAFEAVLGAPAKAGAGDDDAHEGD